MSSVDLQTNIISLCRLLLQKGIAFAVYRFPGTREYQLAIQEGIPAGSPATRFIIAPFRTTKRCPGVWLQKVEHEALYEKIYHYVQRLSDQPINWGMLPQEITKEEYLKKIDQYQDMIRHQGLLKAILSRTHVVEKPPGFDFFEFFCTLTRAYPETFVSLFYLPGSGIWTGASPELLIKREHSLLRTLALAATLPRNGEATYAWREKEQKEHAMVRQHIETVFAKNNCSLIQRKGPYSFETGQVAHLRTDYLFEYKNEGNLQNLLDDLHPTPAVGGLPVARAMACIRSHEGYCRDFYSGFLGETNGRDYAHLFINLRCMRIGEKEMAFYIGGGISAGSDAEEEWNETVQKSLTLRNLVKSTVKSMPN